MRNREVKWSDGCIRRVPTGIRALKAVHPVFVALAFLAVPIMLFVDLGAAAQSRLLVADGLTKVSRFSDASGAYYAGKNFAVAGILNKCQDKIPANNAQAEFIRFLGGRMSKEAFEKMCRRAEDRKNQLQEIDKELLKRGIILGDIGPRNAPPFGKIPNDPKLVEADTAIGFDVGDKSVTVARGPGTGLEPGAESFYVNDSWRLNDKWSFNIGVRYDQDRVGVPAQELTPYVSFGGGLNGLGQGDIQLNGFNQFLNTNTAQYVAVEIGVEKRLGGNYKFLGSVVLQYSDLDLKSLGNNPPAVGTLPLGGQIQSFSIAPRIGLSRDIIINGKTVVQPWAAFGVGIASQDLKATNSGATVLSGSKTTAMVTFAGGAKFPVNDHFSIGLNGFANWFDGFNVTAGPGVNASMASRTEYGGYVSLEIRNPLDLVRRLRGADGQ